MNLISMRMNLISMRMMTSLKRHITSVRYMISSETDDKVGSKNYLFTAKLHIKVQRTIINGSIYPNFKINEIDIQAKLNPTGSVQLYTNGNVHVFL